MVAAVLDNSLVPVVVVRGERGGVRRMLVCTAAGEPGKQDVRVGARLARRFGAVVTLLHVDRPAEPTSDAARRHLEQAVATMRAHDVSVEVRARSSRSPAHGILEEARAGDHDVIVMGGSLPGDDRASSPDVTLQVLLGADRPVMVVPFEKS
jgi:nucleotide-binding universal stress UspA family protein